MNRHEQHIQVVTDGIASTARLLGIDQPTYGGTPVLTETQAKEVQKIVTAWLDERGGYGDEARMYEPGHEGPMWVISLEGGPEDWPILLSHDESVTWPACVFAEPVTSWCLGLYPVN